MTLPILKLAPGCQSYDWGKKGEASLAAQLASQSIPDFKVDEKKTYAEVSCPPFTVLGLTPLLSSGWAPIRPSHQSSRTAASFLTA
jgi:hypothetical protein